jgi:hypothetical protein
MDQAVDRCQLPLRDPSRVRKMLDCCHSGARALHASPESKEHRVEKSRAWSVFIGSGPDARAIPERQRSFSAPCQDHDFVRRPTGRDETGHAAGARREGAESIPGVGASNWIILWVLDRSRRIWLQHRRGETQITRAGPEIRELLFILAAIHLGRLVISDANTDFPGKRQR